MSGYGRRPIWNDPRTTKVAAINTWKAKQEQCQQEGQINLAHRRNRKFADEWHLSIKGYQTMTSLDNRKRQRAQSTDATDGEAPHHKAKSKENSDRRPKAKQQAATLTTNRMKTTKTRGTRKGSIQRPVKPKNKKSATSTRTFRFQP